ncbi:fatty acid synthase subunit alpha [Purpureocillium lavendulum]|uniref:Fatty acid synthase subunit alpha n=1 Tax=Purpureocillium lavendulum TaxID=1247861 RepID=A0AB34FZ47_9HYPO|nr:fatty acid synthase subunit alpha [Purpureocillium lavendulum]
MASAGVCASLLSLLLLLLIGIPPASTLTEFFIPGPPPYPHWTAGALQEIRYRTTLTEYTIAIWQQFEGAAKLGPILYRTSLRPRLSFSRRTRGAERGECLTYMFRLLLTGAETTNGPDQHFYWLVQTYDLDLTISDKFFLWLFEGNSSVQGKASSDRQQQSSGFFYISAALSSASPSPSPSPSASSSSATWSSSFSSSSPLSPSSSPSGSSSSLAVPATTGGGSKATGVDGPQSDSTIAGARDISAGAKAGIGIGAGVAGLGLLSAFLLFIRYRSKKNRELQALRLNNYRDLNPSTSKTAVPPAIVAGQPPFELPGMQARPVVELG